jgi:NhaP-type Na+/H+ or K+/H+ antiporter
MAHIVNDELSIHHAPEAHHHRHLSSFWRHFLAMLAVMAAGMIATGAIFVFVVGLKSWDQVTVQYPTQALLAMAAGMTIPMVAWMLFRGMGRKNSAEMAAAMVLPVVPFLCLVWFGVTKGAWCGPYCAVTIAAMLGLMFYRRNLYSATRAIETVSARPSDPARRTR